MHTPEEQSLFNKNGTILGNTSRVNLALPILLAGWLVRTGQLSPESPSHGNACASAPAQTSHAIWARTYIPATVLGCVIGAMAVLGPINFLLGSGPVNQVPPSIGFLGTLLTAGVLTSLPMVRRCTAHRLLLDPMPAQVNQISPIVKGN